MKKSIIFLLFVALSVTAFSQVKVRPGVRLGLNLSSVSNIDHADAKIGPNAAIFANIRFANFYALQPEATYSNQGAKDAIRYYNYGNSFDPGYYYYSEDLSIHYLGVALANKFYIVPNVGVHLIVGPAIDVKVADNLDDDSIIPVDFSLFGGVGYEFPFGLGIEARYKQGLLDIRDDFYDNYDEDNDDFWSSDSVLNGSIQFGVYYKFDF
ncbi:porin family protein [Mangrovimonas spongiae]|uniref:PorT family protein n=1 Tax=Mangrovimonas spongiae TaxID=2494697 RepID=A0A3R9MUY1_9FLAO|nr:porin family protein [Mangrovimonas spongiae]RSK41388.1 PorT family protein [Mangrovimonas spongiae]